MRDDNYRVKKWFAWRPVNVNPPTEPMKIVWLKYVVRWWHPLIGLWGSWIYAELTEWYEGLIGKKIGEADEN